jgi:hypothetical protein
MFCLFDCVIRFISDFVCFDIVDLVRQLRLKLRDKLMHDMKRQNKGMYEFDNTFLHPLQAR